ncbi:hypothetical transcript [Echinococcus multilocularis]|uniref:Hypothetical transcript n=1 Tax=Echinococcus multilocularis TaxID=6211 RepID=A0A068XXI9_ECHMU|nr:hypothetical transcript [Echinococcus multilocularis]
MLCNYYALALCNCTDSSSSAISFASLSEDQCFRLILLFLFCTILYRFSVLHTGMLVDSSLSHILSSPLPFSLPPSLPPILPFNSSFFQMSSLTLTFISSSIIGLLY